MHSNSYVLLFGRLAARSAGAAGAGGVVRPSCYRRCQRVTVKICARAACSQTVADSAYDDQIQ
jgi:hypothetical protein